MRSFWLLGFTSVFAAICCARGATDPFDDDDDDGQGGWVQTTSTETTSTETTSTETTSTETTSTETTSTETTSTTSTTTTTTTTTSTGSGGVCYSAAGYCNPMQNDCGAGESCDLGCDEYGFCWVDCFPPPNDVPIGGTCDAAAGPWCVPGAFCADYTCRKYCCTAADCPGATCTFVETFTTDMLDDFDLMVCL